MNQFAIALTLIFLMSCSKSSTEIPSRPDQPRLEIEGVSNKCLRINFLEIEAQQYCLERFDESQNKWSKMECKPTKEFEECSDEPFTSENLPLYRGVGQNDGRFGIYSPETELELKVIYSIPQNLKLTEIESGRWLLSWDSLEGANSYVVYVRIPGDEYEDLAIVTVNEYRIWLDDEDLGTEFSVTSVIDGEEGDFSESILWSKNN